MGYTPAFDDIYMGTLYGKWPAAPVWATLLPLIDKNGRIDMSIQAIAGMTGWPLDLLTEGIRQLMEPDPGSRSADADGRRLMPIDTARPWGWVAVNHGKYRERARKQRFDQERTDSGRDAERKRVVPDASREVPTPPDAPRSHTHTQTHTQTKRGERAPAREPPPTGLNSQAWQQYEAYRREIRKPIKPASVLAAQRKLAGFGSDQSAVVEQSIANSWQGLFALKTDFSPKARPNGGEPPRAI